MNILLSLHHCYNILSTLMLQSLVQQQLIIRTPQTYKKMSKS